MTVQTRNERSQDIDAVAEIHREAFGDHGAAIARLVGDLRATSGAEDGLSLVAEEQDGLVGHVLFSPGIIDADPCLVSVQILSPVGVRPSAQRRGVASGLIRHGVEILDARRVPAVFLEGDPRFYSRLGFVPAGPLGFRKPSLRIPDCAFQVMTLSAYEPWMIGTLVYPDAFWRHDAVGLRGA
jgi:putative acetyltransferase